MERIWKTLFLILLGSLFLVPCMLFSIEIRKQGEDRVLDAEKASCILSYLYDDQAFLMSLGGGTGGCIDYDEEGLAGYVRGIFGEELIGLILVKEDYLRVDRGEGLGPPRFYCVAEEDARKMYRRERDVYLRIAEGREEYLMCSEEERDSVVYGLEERMGLARAPMRAGIRVFLSSEVTLPFGGRLACWKKRRECRIFLN